MMTDFFNVIDSIDSDGQSVQRCEKTDQYTDVSCVFELQWHSENATHRDCHFQQRLNFWQDYFPPELEALMTGKSVGHSASIHYEPGRLVSEYQSTHCIRVPHDTFTQHSVKSADIRPQLGRFYPKKLIAGNHGIYEQDITPMRVTGIDGQLDLDLNHPLARFELSLTASILDICSSSRQGGLSQDIGELVTANGPGMQARWQNQSTDFWSRAPFRREDTQSDTLFYNTPRLVDHIDSQTSSQIAELYRRLIGKGDSVLDLMASWKSHLPDNLVTSQVTGLGMNHVELANNPKLDEFVIHDLNENPILPFEREKFETVVCALSIEYLIKPLEVFAEVHRVLKPGGRFIVTFSNRWFPTKAVRIWENLHDYERMGLVLEYFILPRLFVDLHTWSMRGLPRPGDDKYADRLSISDPVYAVWGTKEVRSERDMY